MPITECENLTLYLENPAINRLQFKHIVEDDTRKQLTI